MSVKDKLRRHGWAIGAALGGAPGAVSGFRDKTDHTGKKRSVGKRLLNAAGEGIPGAIAGAFVGGIPHAIHDGSEGRFKLSPKLRALYDKAERVALIKKKMKKKGISVIEGEARGLTSSSGKKPSFTVHKGGKDKKSMMYGAFFDELSLIMAES